MHDDLAFRRRIDDHLHRLVDEEEAELLRLSSELRPLCDQLRSSLTRGKRMRAAFLYWGWRAAGQPDCDGVIRAAAAMELVHAAACTHDDIIDDSLMRHGVPTAHAAFSETGAARWGGSGGSSGSGDGSGAVARTLVVRQHRSAALAMMLGDLLMGYAAQVFATCGLPGAYVARTVPLWSTLLRETVAGEFLEVLRTGTDVPEVAESLEVARYKTAKYTVERPLHMGATLGGAPRQVMTAFTAYGLPLGEAFQLRDDLIGTFGDPAETGKSNLDDLRDRKPTALLATTLALLEPHDRALLDKTLDSPALDESDAALVRRLMDGCGARRRVEDMISDRVATARGALDSVALPMDVRTALAALATSATARTL
ncbi:polyprenyl synthetase family protein [Streptomyces antarcticus]|uniref:polyprenyl synthetase family protein n=1 Tax=Streptomyces antarcticus TaxID=2996458 RepID=UPI0022715621|nr:MULTISPECIES: polyprenyl synthetase family protein [unclassified Streptomyces]MCY0946873.1 polyprenyl synthetase family protein [Streptomyces sp. H34-AA3]MCZ4085627.1 polyprenyl synthetase family protein [Streptomyces sp. H34-S5]